MSREVKGQEGRAGWIKDNGCLLCSVGKDWDPTAEVPSALPCGLGLAIRGSV